VYAVVSVTAFLVAAAFLPHAAIEGLSPDDAARAGRVVGTSNILLAMLAAWGSLSLRFLVLNFRAGPAADVVSIARRWRLFLAFFTPVMLVLLAWWVGEWPGHWKTDEAYLYQQAREGITEPWLSTGFSVYAILVLRTLGNYTLISLVNCVVIAVVIADVLSLLVHAGLRRWIAVVVLVLACTSIPLGLLATSLSHDLVSAALRLCLFAQVTRCVVRRALVAKNGSPTASSSSTGWPAAFHAGFLVVLATTLRGENIALVLVVPLVLRLAGALRPRQAVLCAVGWAVLALVLKGPITRSLSRPSPDRESRYALTLVINPLSYYAANNYWSPTPDADRAVLANVVDLTDLAKYHTPYDIQTYWVGASKGDVTPAEIREVKALFVRATLDNPGLFISSRFATASAMLGMSARSNLWFYDHREERPLSQYAAGNPPMQRAFDDGYIWSDPPHTLARLTHELRDKSVPRGWASIGHWVWNAWPSAIVLVGALACARRTPKTALAACVIAAPFALVALAAPASHFKYVYDVYVAGGLLAAVWVWEWTRTGRKRWQNGRSWQSS
jgi:hypothetical protein